MLVLLLASAMISGSEVAFFSLSPSDKKDLENSDGRSEKRVIQLLEMPNRLLATILIANNFVNVAIIILSTYVTEGLLNFEHYPLLGFLFQVVIVTFLLLLMGEIIPKVRANKNSLRFALFMGFPLYLLIKLFYPLSTLLIRTSARLNKNSKSKSSNISVDELSHMLELTEDDHDQEDKKILTGIVRFGNTDAKQIMTSRMDVVAFDTETNYKDLLDGILESGFSRIPIYEESFDQIKGLIYIKDLLPHIDAEKDFKWQELLRDPMFVTENKKIDDLLSEFQSEKMHLAIVVDEYGGTSGIVSLEDILEEIVGEISDEFDDDDLAYSKLDAHNYVFEGKTPLNDIYRVLEIDGSNFERAKGEADTLAGLVLELVGKIPQKNERVKFEDFTFTIEAADPRRIKRIKLTLPNAETEAEKDENTSSGRLTSIVLILLMGWLTSCGGDYYPKPRGYFRIDLPVHEYRTFASDCPYEFEYSKHAVMVDESKRQQSTCQYNLFYPRFNCVVHLTYKPVEDKLLAYTKESRELAYYHIAKADDLQEGAIRDTEKRVFGFSFDLKGATASNYQFILTDSNHHFLRGAMYFNVAPNPDSLDPVTNYVKEDIALLLESFRWKEEVSATAGDFE